MPTQLQDRAAQSFRTWPFRLTLLLSVLLAVNSEAQLPVARLFTVFPCGGRAGSTVEVEVSGQDLEDVRELHFSNTNISAKQIKGPKFAVALPPSVRLGIYDVRAVGRFGISNPRAFFVGDLPEEMAVATNTTAESAMPVALNSTVNGRTSSESFQFFKVAAKKEKRILVECEAAELDSKLNPTLTLLDGAGREMAWARGNELLDVQAAADAEYIIKLHDALYRGGPEYFYRLTISTRPHIDYVLPSTGLAGTKTKVKLFGRNLPGSKPAENVKVAEKPLEELEVEIAVPPKSDVKDPSSAVLLKPAAALVAGFEYRLSTTQGPSNPIFISFADAPVVLEQEPNDKPENAQRVSLPCEFVGQFFPAHDRDWVVFEGKKGEAFRIDVLSERLGLPTAPFLVIQRVTKSGKGEEEVSDVRELYDAESHDDFKASSRFEVKEDGQYRVEISDLFNSHSDPQRVYQLSMRTESPDFGLVAVPQATGPPQKDSKAATILVPFLRKGETIPLKILALRQDDFAGPIDVSVEGLPKSISATHAHLEASTNPVKADKPKKNEIGSESSLFLTASKAAAGWNGTFEIVGRASTPSGELVRRARASSIIWNSGDTSVEPAQARLTRDMAIAVSNEEDAPIVIAPKDKTPLESCVAGKLDVPVKIARHGEFNSALKLKPIGVPGLEGAKEIDVDAKATNVTVQLDLAKAQAGEYDLVLQTQAQGKYRSPAEGTNAKPRDVTIAVYSRPIPLKIAAAPIVLSDVPGTNTARAGQKLQIPINIKRLFGFEDAVDLTLSAPKSIKELKPAKTAIGKGEHERAVEFAIPSNTAPGSYDFSLEAEMKFNKSTLKIDRKVPVQIVAAESVKNP